MPDSSVVPIDVAAEAREQASSSPENDIPANREQPSNSAVKPAEASELTSRGSESRISGREAARGLKKQPPQSAFESPEVANNAVDGSTAIARDALAERYFINDLDGQRTWYGQKAESFKKRSELLALLTIVFGASITFIQVFGAAPWVPIVSGSIGAIVAIAASWQRIARYNETWISYRTASERMKRERRLYTHGAGSYRALPEREAYLTFVEAIEAIIAEEQNIFWRGRGNNPPAPPDNSKTKIAGAARIVGHPLRDGRWLLDHGAVC
jgi:hypothetical protein